MTRDKMKDVALQQGAAFGLGAACGAVTKHAVTPSRNPRATPLALQVGSAVGAAAAGGAGVSGSVAAGVGIVTAKVVAVTALATAAAPFVLGAAAVGGAAWGVKKLLEKK